MDGHFREVNFPASSAASTPIDQNLGVNDEGIVVGFYNDASGNSHGYEYDIWTRRFSTVVDPGAPAASLTAAAINDRGDVAGFYANPATGTTDGFLLSHGHFKGPGRPRRVLHDGAGRQQLRRGGRCLHDRLGQLGRHARLHLDPGAPGSAPSMTRTAPVPPPSTA